MIELGGKARDKVTEFEGIITGRAQYLTGCDQYVLAPPLSDGNFQRSEWLDEGRLEVIGEGISASVVVGERPGSPNRAATRT